MSGSNNQLAPSNSVLESLPPIVPSIGFTKGKRSAIAAAADPVNPNDPTTTIPALAASESQSATNNANDQSANNSNTPHINNPTTNIPSAIKLGNRLILTAQPPRPWAWKSFTSSARNDSCQFHHWVRASVEYADYPYARFDVSLDPLVYSEEEYGKYLEMKEVVELNSKGLLGEEYDLVTGERKRSNMVMQEGKNKAVGDTTDGNKSNNDKPLSSSLQNQLSIYNKILPWTKSETDALMELVQSCDLRWPVIIDRWHVRFNNSPTSSLRKVEDLQHRYYQVGSILAQRRAEAVMAREVAKLSQGVAGQVGGGEVGASSGVDGAAGQPAVAVAAAPVVGSSVAKAEKDENVASAAATSTGDSKPPPSTTTQPQPTQPQPPQQQQQSKLPPAEVQALKAIQQQTSLHPTLAPPLSLPATGTAHRGAKQFDLAAERARRAQLDRIWNRSKEEEREEEALRAELRSVEAQLRKLKKGGKHLVPAGSALAAPPPTGMVDAAAMGGMPVGVHANAKRGAVASFKVPSSTTIIPLRAPSRPPVDPLLHTRQSVSASFVDTAPVPTPGTPYLQSGRLFPPSIGGHSGLNKSTLKQMNAILEELHVPKEPIPTKRSCDLYDVVRKDALTLLILQKMVLRKESELSAKRSKLVEIQAAAVEAARRAEEFKSEEDKDAKVEGAAAKGNAKSKKGGSKAKAKRPRADSGASSGSNQAAAEGAGKKKKAKKKSAAAATNTAANATDAPSIPPASAVPSVPTGLPGLATSHGKMPPPAPMIAPKAAVSPMVASGKQKQPPSTKQSQPPSLLPPSGVVAAAAAAPHGNNAGTAAGSGVVAAAATAAPVIYPGKTAKKAGKKRGRKKST